MDNEVTFEVFYDRTDARIYGNKRYGRNIKRMMALMIISRQD
jgi:hypothetical protein